MDPLLQLQTALSDRYHVDRQIGVGGMATVYLARDLRHERHVALKLLKPELGAVLGVERFLSEIRVTANLQHPHLLPLFDSGEADGLLYYVMPYVEGESLRGRLDREKQLPVSEAIRITVAVAGALDYAHRHNVVHRDLKPENILLQDGQPVVSDFGIALAVTNAGGTRVTQTGLSLGTPQYMSPEQATGDRLIDARSDIYSLAAVLYEMLTGEPPHTGSTVQAIIARVLTDRVRSVRATRDTVPENVDAALQRALAKLPADRFETAKEFAEALQDPRYSLPIPVIGASGSAAATTGAIPVAAGARDMLRFAPWAVAAAGVAVGAWGLTSRQSVVELPPPAQFSLSLPDSMRFRGGNGDIAVSPDGDRIALVVTHQGTRRLAVRALDGTDPRLLEGTEGALRPFFSPDGAMLGFTADGRLRSVSLAGGGAMTRVGSGVAAFGATWGESGIVFASQQGFMRLPTDGGTPVPLTSRDSSRGEVHAQPSAAPNGRVLFVLGRTAEPPALAVAEPDGSIRLLGHSGLAPIWVETGHVLYNSVEGNLMLLPVDRRLTPAGAPILLLDGIRTGANAVGIWSASRNGTIVVQRANTSGSSLVLVDRTGRSTPLSAEAKRYRLPRVSPDGNRIAVQASLSGISADAEIWILDRRTGALSRFTTGGGNSDAIWTPEGDRIAWAGPAVADTNPNDRNMPIEQRAGADIYWQASDRSSPPEVILAAPLAQWPWSFTPDGKTLVFDEGGGGTRIRALTIGSADAPRTVVANEYTNRTGRLSPDGRWLAYASNETGRYEVYVRPFPGPGGATQVSVDGASQPMWSRDGRELFYRDAANVVSAQMARGTVTSRSVLFPDTYDLSNATNYDVFPGGGFVMLLSPGESGDLTVLVNWKTEIGRRTGAAQP
ncbi:MAG TPA: protein kinase [Gemmatimonadaceae bacterium]